MGMTTTWEIQTGASTRSKARQTMNHQIRQGTEYRDLVVTSEDDARYVARMLHIERVGWNASIWINTCKEA